MAKKPRPTKGVPEAVFQKELKAYLTRKEANPGKRVSAKFTYKGTTYTFERGNGPYNSGYQIKTSAGQAAKEMARTEQKQSIKLSEGEKMFMRDKYAAAAERNAKEGRKGNRKLEVDHVEPRSKGGLHHPYNLRLMERGNNGSKGNKQGGFGKFESLLGDLDLEIKRSSSFAKGANAMKLGGNLVLEYGSAFVEIGDHYTNGAVSNAIENGTKNLKNGITNGVQAIGNGIANGVNSIVDAYAATKPNKVDLTGS